jgi:hypothetical protein
MTTLHPGIHPNFDITRFDVADQRVLRRMAQLFHLTREGELKIGTGDSKYRYALIKPTKLMQGLLHTEREVMVVFSSYPEFQARTLDAFDHIIENTPEDFRIEKVVRILISGDQHISRKLKDLFKSRPDAPIVVPFHTSEFSLATTDEAITSRVREFTFSRDLFSVSSPLRSDLYFYGRTGLINEIVSKLASGENFGLFGLRRSGKTSLVSGVSRALKGRSGHSITIDCQSPSVHQLRWNELLRHIVHQLKSQHGLPIGNEARDRYEVKNAADSFLKDMRQIKSKLKTDFIAILFDEIERISYGTASSPHWNDERDFLLLWQSIRAGFQSEGSPFTFLVVGTNPSAIERPKRFESDNPLFGNVEKRFIPMFTEKQVEEMVDDLGSIMGIGFNGECKIKLFQDFGGHPFLTRHACSFIAREATKRPTTIDRTIYASGVAAYTSDADSYVDSVVGLLQEEYEDEFEMLKFLGHGDNASFDSLANDDPRLLEHLKGYGLITAGAKAHYFSIGIVANYFSRRERPAELMTQSARKAEISKRRNDLEISIRKYIFQIGTFAFSKKDRRERLLSKLTQNRRDQVQLIELDEMFMGGESPLFFNELASIILGHWPTFENSIEVQKGEFEYHMSVVNGFRVDAHAKDINDGDFQKIRVSLSALEQAIPSGY